MTRDPDDHTIPHDVSVGGPRHTVRGILSIEYDAPPPRFGDLDPLDEYIVPTVEVDGVARRLRRATRVHSHVSDDDSVRVVHVERLGVLRISRIVFDNSGVHPLPDE